MKKIIDSDGRLFSKINIIDFLVLIILFIVACASIYRFKGSINNINKGSRIIYYRVKIQDVKKSSSKFYKKNLDIYDSNTRTCIGRIKNIKIKDFYDYILDTKGIIHKVKKPDRIEIILDIKSKGIETNQAYLLNGTYELKVGSAIYLLTKYADVIGSVYKIF